MDEDKIAELRKLMSQSRYPKYPRLEKHTLFVGNLPYAFEENEIGMQFKFSAD